MLVVAVEQDSNTLLLASTNPRTLNMDTNSKPNFTPVGPAMKSGEIVVIQEM
ncbi:MAG: hypothetical protein ACI9K2_004263 [Myxococcota bacterium]|jgi:hypothetical protein